MKALSIPAGTPYFHAGVSHALKHYLAASEAWEDIADAAPERARPRATAMRLGLTDAVAVVPFPELTQVLASSWAELSDASRAGYAPVVAALLETVPEPGQHGSPWSRTEDAWIAHIGEGVVAVVMRERDGRWRLLTAYRPFDFKLRDYSCPPVDATSVSIRRRLALAFAAKKLTQRRES